MLLRINVGILADVGIGAEQVFVSVVIKVVDARAPTAQLDTAKTDARSIRISAEESVALIAEEREGLAPKRGHEQAWLAVIVPVTKVDAHAGHRHAIFRIRDEGLDPDLVESVAGAIPEEKIPVVVVRDENVHPSVAIVVG